MSKSILVIDTLETCIDCRFCRELHEGIEACCEICDELDDKELCRMIDVDYCQEKPDWCPFRDLPEKREMDTRLSEIEYFRRFGFNDCINEILEGVNTK